MLFSSWISSPAWFAMNWTQMPVWAHCGMLTLLAQVPVQLQRQKKLKFTTQESQLTSAFPTLSQADWSLIRN